MDRNASQQHGRVECQQILSISFTTTIDSADEELDVPSLQKVIIEQLTQFINRFKFYFPTEDDTRKVLGA